MKLTFAKTIFLTIIIGIYAEATVKTFINPQIDDYFFLGNTVPELEYSKYPGFSSYPISYPGNSSYPNSTLANTRLMQRALGICQLNNYKKVKYVSSEPALVDPNTRLSELIYFDADQVAQVGKFGPDYGPTKTTQIKRVDCFK